MSIVGRHLGQEDNRFLPLYDLIKIINYLQANQYPKPLYLLENTWPSLPGEYPLVDQAASVVEAFLGAPIVVDAAGTVSVSHRPRLFWQNFYSSEILQAAVPSDILPHPPVAAILHPFHLPTVPNFTPTSPFALLNRRGQPRITMPTVVSFARSHAFCKGQA